MHREGAAGQRGRDEFYAYTATGTDYKLVNHFQVKYRVSPTTGQFNGYPTILHEDALVGATVNPTGIPPGALIPAQKGPMNNVVLMDYPNNTRISLVNDGSPDAQGIKAFNTLEGLDVPTPMFWENIGSQIIFTSPGWGNSGGWGPSLPHQPYPSYNEYLNGSYIQTIKEASSPTKNFNPAPYPFGTVPSTFPFAPTVPGGRGGDASSPPDPTAAPPSGKYIFP